MLGCCGVFKLRGEWGMSRHMFRSIGVVAAAAVLTAGLALAQERQGAPGGGGQGRGGGRGPQTPPLIMTSTAWEDGGVIPDKYTQAAGPTAPRAQMVAGAAGHTELRAVDARSRTGVEQGIEDGHHALAGVEHPRHVDRSARRRDAGGASGWHAPG